MKYLLIIIFVSWSINISRAQEKWVLSSVYLEKPDTVLVFKPRNYNKVQSYPLVYLLHGYSENYKQWAQTTDLQKLADQYGFMIITPDGFTTYYINSPLKHGVQFETFFFKELVPKVHRSFNIDAKNIFISGLSMGGYGALRYFILHQDYFNSAGAMSGALDIDAAIFRAASRAFWSSDRMVNDLSAHLGVPENHNWNQYSIFNLVRQNPGFNRPFIFDCGTEDILYPASARLKRLTDSLEIPATFISRPGTHNTAYWQQAVDYHFLYFKQRLK